MGTKAIAQQNGKKGGRPKGAKNAKTLEKEAVLAEYRSKIMQSADVLFNSQLHLATGQTYLFKIEKRVVETVKGKKRYENKLPKRVTAEWEIRDYLQGLCEEGDMDNEWDPAATYYFITAKDADNKAIDSMLDRSFGKSMQRVEMGGPDGSPITVNLVQFDK